MRKLFVTIRTTKHFFLLFVFFVTFMRFCCLNWRDISIKFLYFSFEFCISFLKVFYFLLTILMSSMFIFFLSSLFCFFNSSIPFLRFSMTLFSFSWKYRQEVCHLHCAFVFGLLWVPFLPQLTFAWYFCAFVFRMFELAFIC